MKKLLIIIGVTVGLNTSIVAGPIHEWAIKGNIEQIKSLINIGVGVDHKDEGGNSIGVSRSTETKRAPMD